MMIPETRVAMEEMVKSDRASIKQVILEAINQLKEERQAAIESVIN